MLREIKSTRQIPDEPRRRWFDGQDCDLLVWLDDNRRIWGFEFRYRRKEAALEDRVFSWHHAEGLDHRVLDLGRSSAEGGSMTPVYGERVSCDYDYVARLFRREVEDESDQVLKDIAAILTETRKRMVGS